MFIIIVVVEYVLLIFVVKDIRVFNYFGILVVVWNGNVSVIEIECLVNIVIIFGVFDVVVFVGIVVIGKLYVKIVVFVFYYGWLWKSLCMFECVGYFFIGFCLLMIVVGMGMLKGV